MNQTGNLLAHTLAILATLPTRVLLDHARARARLVHAEIVHLVADVHTQDHHRVLGLTRGLGPALARLPVMTERAVGVDLTHHRARHRVRAHAHARCRRLLAHKADASDHTPDRDPAHDLCHILAHHLLLPVEAETRVATADVPTAGLYHDRALALDQSHTHRHHETVGDKEKRK